MHSIENIKILVVRDILECQRVTVQNVCNNNPYQSVNNVISYFFIEYQRILMVIHRTVTHSLHMVDLINKLLTRCDL